MDESMQMGTGSGLNVRTVIAKGVVGPNETVPVGARASGVIQVLSCDTHMQVKVGQICAKIDPRPYQIAVDQSRAGLQAIEAQLEKDQTNLASAKAALERQEELAKRRIISHKALDKSRKSFGTAQAEATRDKAKAAELQAALHTAETSLGSTDIVSPLDGTVVLRKVELGQTVMASSKTPPLFVIAGDLSLVHIDATLSTQDSREVKPGDKVTFTVDAFPDRQFSGTVTEIRPSPIDERAALPGIVISTPNPDLLLKPGMAATIRIMKE
ncbi:efflux RND transporter periplasmic adaptor subunit [Methylocapsa sp. D3K7]|uniref:efflux RND transporter periplasmic adaptor subunit n=1 Tax=Methylocapsa sp. D3K7 TaxID=3041435 RepID=UPI003297F853